MKVFNVIKKYEKCANRFLNYDREEKAYSLGSKHETDVHQTEFTLHDIKKAEKELSRLILDSYRWELVEVVS